MNKVLAKGSIIMSVARQKTDPSVLAAFVRRSAYQKELELGDIAARAKRAGWEITESYISKIIAGKAGHLTVPKLQALAAGLGVSEDEIFAVARGIEPPKNYTSSDLYVLYEKFLRLRDPRHQEFILELVAMLTRKTDQYLDRESESPEHHGATGTEYKLEKVSLS